MYVLGKLTTVFHMALTKYPNLHADSIDSPVKSVVVGLVSQSVSQSVTSFCSYLVGYPVYYLTVCTEPNARNVAQVTAPIDHLPALQL